MKKNEYVTFCKCGCCNGIILKADKEDEVLSLQLVSDNFYVLQNKMTIREKLRRIWYILINKEYCYFDIFINKKELEEFKEFIANL